MAHRPAHTHKASERGADACTRHSAQFPAPPSKITCRRHEHNPFRAGLKTLEESSPTLQTRAERNAFVARRLLCLCNARASCFERNRRLHRCLLSVFRALRLSRPRGWDSEESPSGPTPTPWETRTASRAPNPGTPRAPDGSTWVQETSTTRACRWKSKGRCSRREVAMTSARTGRGAYEVCPTLSYTRLPKFVTIASHPSAPLV